MLLSMEDLFSDGQAITTTAVSDNVIDLGQERDIGPGDTIPLRIQTTAAFTGSTDLQVQLQVDTQEDMSTATVAANSPVIPVASLVAGFHQFGMDYVSAGTRGRYLRLNYVVTGTDSTGALFAGISTGHQHNGQEYTYASAGTN